MNKPAHSDGTVGKALRVLDLVAEAGRPVRFAELLGASDYPKATLFRFMQTLTKQGMLSYDAQGQTYALGLRLVRLAHSAWEQSSLAPLARPYLKELAQKVGETIHLAQMEQGQVLFVDKHKTTDRFETLAEAGRVAPAHCTGVGKAILAFMSPDRLDRAMKHQNFIQYTPATHISAEGVMSEFEEIRRHGVAYDREEHEEEIISIAAPILTLSGQVIGAVSIASSTHRNSIETLTSYREELIKTTKNIGTEASAWRFPS